MTGKPAGKVAEIMDGATGMGETADTSLGRFLLLLEEALTRFVNGEPALLKQIASRREDATIMGAWGAYERGWHEVGPRYEWAASRLEESGARVEIEYLSSVESGDLAYTVAIERSEAHLAGRDQPMPMTLRVTHAFRKEEGGWKLLHRHADPLVEKTAPATVLQESP